jgi:hypothetical protein
MALQSCWFLIRKESDEHPSFGAELAAPLLDPCEKVAVDAKHTEMAMALIGRDFMVCRPRAN